MQAIESFVPFEDIERELRIFQALYIIPSGISQTDFIYDRALAQNANITCIKNIFKYIVL